MSSPRPLPVPLVRRPGLVVLLVLVLAAAATAHTAAALVGAAALLAAGAARLALTRVVGAPHHRPARGGPDVGLPVAAVVPAGAAVVPAVADVVPAVAS